MKKMLVVVALICVVSTVSFAQLGLYSIGAAVGFVSVSNEVGSGLSFGAGADLGEITTGLHLRPEIGYWSVSRDDFGVDVTSSDFIINANVIYAFMNGTERTPFFAGGGIGLNSVSSEVVVPGSGTFSASESKIGINLIGGVLFPMAEKIMIGGEARYVIISDFGHFGVHAVVVFVL